MTGYPVIDRSEARARIAARIDPAALQRDYEDWRERAGLEQEKGPEGELRAEDQSTNNHEGSETMTNRTTPAPPWAVHTEETEALGEPIVTYYSTSPSEEKTQASVYQTYYPEARDGFEAELYPAEIEVLVDGSQADRTIKKPAEARELARQLIAAADVLERIQNGHIRPVAEH